MLLHEQAQPQVTELDHDSAMKVYSRWAFDVMTEAGYDVVFATVHGSHLYGTYHAASDLDLFVVVAKGKNRSAVVDGLDVAMVDLDTWVTNAHNGSHQAVEALFSPYLVTSDKWGAFVRAQRPSRYNFVKKCRSACMAFMAKGDAKSVRRAWTQTRHAHSYMRYGDPFATRDRPRLNPARS